MKASDIVGILIGIERDFPVEQWTIDGIRIWPYIRIQLGMDLFKHGQPDNAGQTHSSGTFKKLQGLIRSQARYVRACYIDKRQNIRRVDHAPVMFLSDGVSFTRIGCRWYERFCDPIREYLEMIRVGSLILTPLETFIVPRYSPSKFIQPALDWIQFKHKLLRRNRHGEESLPGFHAFIDRLRQEVPWTIPNLAVIRRHIALIQDYASYFEGVIEKVQPRVCFLVSYYWLVGYGLLLACNRRGVPSVDIQHGVQGNMHFSYASWMRVPKGGYELLPAWFWCWDESDAAVIRLWSDATGGAHSPIVGGNLFLEMWRAGEARMTHESERLLARKRTSGEEWKHILVTLQPGLFDESFSRLLAGAIKTLSNTMRWWIRLHPSMLKDKQRISNIFGQFPNVEIDLATDLPLYALLRHMTVHVTHSSSTVLEAEAFGIGSVVCSRYGMELFHDQAETKVITYAETIEQLKEAIVCQSRRKIRTCNLAQEAGTKLERARQVIYGLLAGNMEKMNLTRSAG